MIRSPIPPRRKQMPPRIAPLAVASPLPPGPGPSRRAPLRNRPREAAGQSQRQAHRSGRAESFPPAVAALLDARDPWCVHCGTPFGLQRHHRRIKGIGGDGRDHTDCACNGVRICLACHDWAHSGNGRREAETEGLIIPRAILEPFRLSVLVHLEEDSGGLLKFPSCDGLWLDYVPERGAA